MFAVIKAGGKQYRVAPDDIIEVEKPDGRRAMAPFRPGVADLVDGRIVVDPDFLA